KSKNDIGTRADVQTKNDLKGLALLTLPKELSEVHDTFHVSNLKKCLADANLHVPLDEIKVDKTLHFVEEPVEIMDHEVNTLKRSKISIVKMRWNAKRSPEFTWEREDHMKARLFARFCQVAEHQIGVSLLLTPLCCDDTHEVTPRVSSLAGCDKLVSEPLVIENYVSFIRKKFRWGTIFLIGLKCYRDPKEEPIGKEPLMELKKIG
ncbi:hypothetical protein Tco_1332442, partial [Tanacetum coccineum]